MTPEENPEVIKIVGARLTRCGFHRISNADILAMIDRITFEHGDKTKLAMANKIVEDCRQDYVNFRESEKIPGTKKYKTKRWAGVEWGDYLGMRDGADDDNALGSEVEL